MTDIEKKALALVNEVRVALGGHPNSYIPKNTYTWDALCRAIEQHEATKADFEAFRREVSEELIRCGIGVCHPLHKFIIPKPVDPLVEAMSEAMCGVPGEDYTQPAKDLREAMKARGYEWTKIEGVA